MLIPMIRAVLFDLDDTLMDHTFAMHAGLDEWCAELGVAQGQHARFSAWRSVRYLLSRRCTFRKSHRRVL